MSGIRISHSPDLLKLESEGFRLRIIDGSAVHLLVEGIPAITKTREVVKGTLYSPLETDQEGRTKSPLDNHQCWWIGEPPCDSDGNGNLMVPADDLVILETSLPTDGGSHVRQIDTENSGALILLRDFGGNLLPAYSPQPPSQCGWCVARHRLQIFGQG